MPGCDSNNGFHGETSEMSSFASYWGRAMIYRPGGVGRFFSRDDMALRGNEEEMGPVVASRV